MLRTLIAPFRAAVPFRRVIAVGCGRRSASNGIAAGKPSAHPKSLLISLCSKLKWPSPVIQCSSTGPPHKPSFSASVKLFADGSVLEFSSSCHNNKSKAVFAAALTACKELQGRGLLSVQIPLDENALTVSPSGNTSGGNNVSSGEELEDTRVLTRRYPALARLSTHPKTLVLHLDEGLKTVRKGRIDPKESFQLMPDKTWQCKLSGSSPMTFNIITKGVSKAMAQHVAYLKLVQSLKTAGWFDENWRPIFYSPGELKTFRMNRGAKIDVPPISEKLGAEIDEIIAMAKDLESDVPHTASPEMDSLELDAEAEATSLASSNGLPNDNVIDMITDKVLEPLDDRRYGERSHYLFSQMRRRITSFSQSLPISTAREEIVKLLDNHRSVIIAGGTGCGKTTQVPQYIFDECVKELAGASCNILVTQPRRISAVSVARRVAQERGERMRDTVGYHVRLECKQPVGNGSILFLTPALLLRKLWYNPNFEGISHVIVDEVHERDLWTEFLLIVLKRAMKANDKLKVLLMSASVDSNKLADYFGDCPVVRVEGRSYEVEEHFLDDVLSVSGANLAKELEPMNTNYKLVLDVLSHIHENRPDGAILCFLPGWSDIVKVRQDCRERYKNQSKFEIYACHSRLPMSEQEGIFKQPPPGVRKIVLSTNIAETSITINDVRYVVNTGSRKNRSTDDNLSRVRQGWASQSSQIQRRGRAGRVSDGECFHLFTKTQFNNMIPYDLPAMVKDSLESAVLFAKVCCPNEDPEILLSEALDPPPLAQVDSALKLLTGMRLLNERKCLTPLGARVARVGCHPMLGVAMVYGTAYRCIEPILTVTSVLQNDDLMQTTRDGNDSKPAALELELKERFAGNSSSDHLAQANLVAAYLKAATVGNSGEFAEENLLRVDRLEHVKALRRLFAWQMEQLGLCDRAEACLDRSSYINENAGNVEIVKAVILAGIHDQLLWLEKGTFQRGRILNNKPCLTDRSNYKYAASAGSLFNSRALLERDWANRLFFYIDKVFMSESNRFRVDGLSAISPLTCLLFGTSVEPVDGEPTKANIQGGRCQFRAADRDASRLFELRNLIRNVVDWKLDSKAQENIIEQRNRVQTRLIALLIELMAEEGLSVNRGSLQAEGRMSI